MVFKEKIKVTLKVLKNFTNKRALLVKTYKVYKAYGLRGVKEKILQLSDRIGANMQSGSSTYEINNQIFERQQSELSFEKMTNMIGGFEYKPLISIVMPVYNVKVKWIKLAIESLQAQVYKNWELCAVDDGSTDKRASEFLEKYAEEDERIRLHCSPKNGGISVASNISLSMANGKYIALMDNDDEITPDALFWVVKEINDYPNADFIYSDECLADDSEEAKKFQFMFKPNWSPESLMGFMYTGHLTVYKTDLVRQVGGFRSEFDIAQDFDLALRVSEHAKCIRHIERVLYIWRAIQGSIANGGKPKNVVIGANVGADTMKRRGVDAITTLKPYGNYYRINYNKVVKVSLIIPSDCYQHILDTVEYIVQNTIFTNYEIIVVCDKIVANLVKKELSYIHQLKFKIGNWDNNISKQFNAGAAEAEGDVLVLYQDSLRYEHTGWLNMLVEQLMLPDVGAVSPKIVRTDDTIRYSGMISGVRGLVGDPFNAHSKEEYDEYLTLHRWTRNVTVLSGTCLGIWRDLFNQVGGFDEVNFPNRFCNADLSYKIISIGKRCIYTPHVVIKDMSNQWWDSWVDFNDKKSYADAKLLQKWTNYVAQDLYFTDTLKDVVADKAFNGYKIHAPLGNVSLNKNEDMKTVLLISHELSITGAPVVLHYAAKSLKDSGYFPVVVSPQDGKMRDELLKDGIMVIIEPLMSLDNWYFERFVKSFDLIIASTLVLRHTVAQLKNIGIPIIWWLHEGKASYDIFKHDLPKSIGDNVHVYTGGEYAQHYLKVNKSSIKSEILLYGLPDTANEYIPKNQQNEKIVFSIIGTVDERKAQDIFIEAINLLPLKYREQAEFWIVGKHIDPLFSNKIKKISVNIPQIKYIEEMSREEILDIYYNSSILVSTSRDDPMPVVLTEGMMFSKPCICSTHTGTASLLKDGQNGYVFKSENTRELAEKIMYVIDNREILDEMGKKARKTYEENFMYETFTDKLTKEVRKLL